MACGVISIILRKEDEEQRSLKFTKMASRYEECGHTSKTASQPNKAGEQEKRDKDKTRVRTLNSILNDNNIESACTHNVCLCMWPYISVSV